MRIVVDFYEKIHGRDETPLEKYYEGRFQVPSATGE
jgi:hypothetical protein